MLGAANDTATTSTLQGWIALGVLAVLWIAAWYAGHRVKVWFRRKLEQARAPVGALLPGSDEAAIVASRPTAGLAAIRAHDPRLDENDLLAGIEAQVARLAAASSQGREDEVRQVVSDDLYTNHRRGIARIAVGTSPRLHTVSAITFAGVRIIGAHSDGRWDTVTVRVGTVTTLSGEGGRPPARVPRLVDLVFQRSSSLTTPPAGLLGRRCPGCQAVLQLDGAGACTFCRRQVMSGAFDWVLTRLEIPGSGIGPCPGAGELAAVTAAAGLQKETVGTARRAAQELTAETRALLDPAALAENGAGRLTADQRHAVIRRARAPITGGIGSALQVTPIIAVAAVFAAAAGRRERDPFEQSVAIGGVSHTLPLLRLGATAVAGLFAVIAVVHLLRALAQVPTWRRAHRPARTVAGEVVFADGAYRVLAGGRPLALWSDGTTTGFAGLAPGPAHIHLAGTGEVLSLMSTADEATQLAGVAQALRAAGLPPPPAGAAATEGWLSPRRHDREWTLTLRGHAYAVAPAVGTAVVGGLWYAIGLSPDGTAITALEPRPAEHATSLAVDRSAVTGGLDAIRAHDPGFDPQLITERLTHAFVRVQEAWCRLDPAVSRGVMGDAVWAVQARLIADCRAHGLRPVQRARTVEGTEIVAAERTGEWETLLCRITWAVTEGEVRTLADGSAATIEGRPERRCEEWVLRRAAAAVTPAGGGTLAARCPNCQAPIDLDDVGVCSYCRVAVMSGALDWVVTRIERVAGVTGDGQTTMTGVPTSAQP